MRWRFSLGRILYFIPIKRSRSHHFRPFIIPSYLLLYIHIMRRIHRVRLGCFRRKIISIRGITTEKSLGEKSLVSQPDPGIQLQVIKLRITDFCPAFQGAFRRIRDDIHGTRPVKSRSRTFQNLNPFNIGRTQPFEIDGSPGCLG